ncbi:hypothetical protein [Streptomyces sp. RFCAC02]|uniref:hypothetical protein n=1 Tax=Streptomyces sp. RFCAC02 TaxID=2499143 RepID=UPI001020688F|nr:hypothetical protein [Streptomyces sp. RFCAC02]
MPLNIHPAPPGAELSVRDALLGSGARLPIPLQHHRAALRPVMPLPVHQLSPVSGLTVPPRSRLVGWRFLLEHDGIAVGGAQTDLTAGGWEFSHFTAGPFIASTVRAVRLAETTAALYQPRLLSVPELYMMTLWLHAEPRADPASGSPEPQDLLVPLAPAPPGITAERPARTDALLPLLTSRGAPLGLAS